MPFRSNQQRRLFYAKHRKGEISGETLKKWQDETKTQQAKGELPAKLPKYVGDMKKEAVLDPQEVFANAFRGALAGAITGSRRSLDDKVLQGVAQGAAIGAIGGILGGHVGESGAGALVGGGLAGAIASRGPRGESRPQLHFRIDKGNGQLLPSPHPPQGQPQEKRAAGEAANVAAMVAPQIGGYFVGRHFGRKQKERGEKYRFGGAQVAGALLAPGGIGYQIGRHESHHEKKGSELRDMIKAKRRMNLDAHAKRMARAGKHWSCVNTTKSAETTPKQQLVARCGECANGVGLKKDASGWYVTTHRARGKSYATVDAIPKDEVERIEKTGSHAAELAGLGILAAPTVAEMRGKKVSDKTKHRAELAGLGVLAAPSAVALARKGIKRVFGKKAGWKELYERFFADYNHFPQRRDASRAAELATNRVDLNMIPRPSQLAGP